MVKKTWKQTITPHLNKYTRVTAEFFKKYKADVKKRGLKTTSEINAFWNKNYKAEFNVIEKRHDREYSKIWNTFHKKI